MRLAWAAILLAAAPAASAQEGVSEAAAKALRALRDSAGKSVVAIEVVRDSDPEGRTGSGGAGSHLDYYNRPAGPCSGTILTEDGYILTCAFNVSGGVKKITVMLADGREFEGKRLGYHMDLDVALVKIEAAGLPVLPRADLSKAAVGDLAAVLGRAPEKGAVTVNLGILSALGRWKNTAVQTDAEMNYGNLGGPLVTLKGELLGIASHIRPRSPWGQSSGVGFATRMPDIEKVLEELKKSKTTERKGREPWMGVHAGEPAEGAEGIPVDQVAANSPAEEAGLESGDLLLEVGGARVKTLAEYKAALGRHKAGDEIDVKFRRTTPKGSEEKTVKVRLVENPE